MHDNKQQRDNHFYNYVLSCELRKVQKDLSEDPPKQYSWREWEYFLKLMGNEQDYLQDEDDDDGGNDDDASSRNASRESIVPGPLRPGASFRFITTSNSTSDGTAENEELQEDAITMEEDKDGPVDRRTELRSPKHRRRLQGGKLKNKLGLRRRPTTASSDPLADWSWLSEESPLMSRKSEAQWIVERLSASLVKELKRQSRGGRMRAPPVGLRFLRMGRKAGEKVDEEEEEERLIK